MHALFLLPKLILQIFKPSSQLFSLLSTALLDTNFYLGPFTIEPVPSQFFALNLCLIGTVIFIPKMGEKALGGKGIEGCWSGERLGAGVFVFLQHYSPKINSPQSK
jgi:hypothetical protein